MPGPSGWSEIDEGEDDEVEWYKESFKIPFPRQDQFCSYMWGTGEFANNGEPSMDPSV